MYVVAIEPYCMKTVIIHLVDKSGFILSDRLAQVAVRKNT